MLASSGPKRCALTSERTAPGDHTHVGAVLDALPEAAAVVDHGGRIRHANGGMQRVFGYGPDELRGQLFERLLPGWHQMATHEGAVANVAAWRSDGTVLMVDVTVSPLGVGGEGALLAVVRDATERIRLEDRLVILEAFLETSDEAVLSHDSNGRVTSWNRSAQRIFGYLRAEVLGQPSTILVPEHLRADAKLVFDTVMDGDVVDHLEMEAVRKDGLPIVISMSLRPVFDADGHLTSSVLVARDITEQRLAQATLAEIDNRGREREALAHVGSWLWDLRTGAVQWSDELHRIHGVDPLDFEGTFEAHLGQVHPDDLVRVRTGMEQAVAAGGTFEDEYRIVRRGGALCWVFSRAEPTVGSAGSVVGLRGIAQDVTARRND